MYFFVWLSTRSHTLNLQTYHLIIQQNHAIWSFYAILCFVKLFPFSYLWIKLSYCKVGVGDCCWLLRRMYLWLKQRRLSPFAKAELNINLLCGSFCLRWDFVSKDQKPYQLGTVTRIPTYLTAGGRRTTRWNRARPGPNSNWKRPGG